MPYLFSALVLLAPLYVWRFSIGGLPTNFLMLANFVVIAAGVVLLVRDSVKQDAFTWPRLGNSLRLLGWPMLVAIGLVGLASVISLLAFGATAEKLAQWTVLYAQPLVLFLLMRYFVAGDPRVEKYFTYAVYAIVTAAGAVAIAQYFTLTGLPEAWWGNANEPKRAIAFFAHANAFSLFVTPLLAWLIPDVVQRLRGSRDSIIAQNADALEIPTAAHWKYIYSAAWLVGAAGMFLSLSRGAWLGLALAATAYVLVSANKKLIISFAVAGLVLIGVVAAVPNLRYRVTLPFHGEKSAVARLSLWQTGLHMVKDNPVFGKGINGFSDNWDQYNTDPNLEHYNFPHNILLNFWIDLGLLGMLGMAAVLAWAAARGLLRRQRVAAFGMLLAVIAIVAHGLIDIPYLKNDLALAFWLLLAVSA